MAFLFKNLKFAKEPVRESPNASNFTINATPSALEKYRISPEELEIQKEKRKRIQHLQGLYDRYRNEYFEYYKKATLQELQDLQEFFPNVEIYSEFRIKGKTSYKNKVIKKVNQGYTGKIYDVFGAKLVVKSYTEGDGTIITDEYGYQEIKDKYKDANIIIDEQKLIAKSYEIINFLESKHSIETREGVCVTETVHSNDYIKSPKESGYQAYHVLRHITFLENDEIAKESTKRAPAEIETVEKEVQPEVLDTTPKISFYSEIQVKIAGMYYHDVYGKYGHATTYKTNRDDAFKHSKHIEDEVPVFLRLSYDMYSKQFDITPYPFRYCFKKFFGKNDKDFDSYMATRKEEITYDT